MFKRIIFIGLGGAGQRHLRIFKQNTPQETELIGYRSTSKTPVLNPDFTVNKQDSLEKLYGVTIYSDLEGALDHKPDLAIISTPSSMHMDYVKFFLSKGISVFVEKPLSNSLANFDEIKSLIASNNVTFQVGFQRRFHPQLSKINDLLKSGVIGRISNVILTVASYIPFWHPYEDFRDLYACRKDLGGGVLLTEIHEFDLCIWYFGSPKSVTCLGGTYSQVGMDVEDTARVVLDYGDFLVQVNLTFWQKHAERSISISAEDGYLFWSQDDNALVEEYYNGREKIVSNISNYTNDMMFDLQSKSVLSGLSKSESEQNLIDSNLSLSIVLAAKRSMDEDRKVFLSEIF